MSDLATLYERNAAFAETFALGDLGIQPRFRTVLLSCVDARVVPAAFAGLEPGDAWQLRTVGGRVTDSAVREVALLWQLMKMAGHDDPALGLAIIQHTDCGMAQFADEKVAEQVSALFGTPEVVETYAIAESRQALRDDVERVVTSALTPSGLVVSGHLYDVTTGRLEEVVAPVSTGR